MVIQKIKQMDPEKRKKIMKRVLIAAAVIGVLWLVNEIVFRMTHVSTNNAQIEGEFYYVTPKVGGMIKEVYVKSNDMVEKGQKLVSLDTTDYEISRTNVSATYDKTKSDFDRINQLYAQGMVSKQEYEHAKAAYESAQAAFAKENQNISYTTLTAPATGMIGKKNAEPGQVIAPGQSLMVVVPLDGLYVVANIKETDIGKIKQGQDVEVSLDAFKGKHFKGKVASIGAATGSKFSLLPPDNAAGNFVKVVQLIPIKILFEGDDIAKYPVRPGMSVEVAIKR
jgi:membrane fusion protein (multidrug efflux system)